MGIEWDNKAFGKIRDTVYNSIMTQQHSASTTDKTPKTADDLPASKGKPVKGFIWLLFLSALAGGGIWAWQQNTIAGFDSPAEQETAQENPGQPAPLVESKEPTPTNDIAELMDRQEQAKRIRLALRKDINALEAQLVGITERLDALQNTVDNLQNNASANIVEHPQFNTAMQADLTALNEKIAALQQDYEKKNQHYLEQLQINQLLDRIALRLREGESYAAEMRQLMLLAPNNGLDKDPLNSLASYADNGAPSLPMLIDMFDEAVQAAIQASLAAKENRGISDEIREHLSRVVTIRRINADVTDDSDEAQIARAENELHMGNVDMTLAHLGQLSDEPRQIFTTWIEAAEAHLAAQDALAQLKNALTQARTE